MRLPKSSTPQLMQSVSAAAIIAAALSSISGCGAVGDALQRSADSAAARRRSVYIQGNPELGAAVKEAIIKHQPIPGMSERDVVAMMGELPRSIDRTGGNGGETSILYFGPDMSPAFFFVNGVLERWVSASN